MDAGAMKMHIRDHMAYPATKAQILEACSMMSDVPAADREWFEKTLPNKTYKNAEAVIKALKI